MLFRKPKYVFQVVTQTSETDLYHASGEVYIDRQHEVDGYERKPRLARGQNYLRPTFELGEIMIVDPRYNREVDGSQRKESKWAVTVEQFVSLDQAVKRAREVLAQ